MTDYFKECDELLEYFRDNASFEIQSGIKVDRLTSPQLLEVYKDRYRVDTDFAFRMQKNLKKLVKDGYLYAGRDKIKFEGKVLSESLEKYSISSDGLYFIEMGGYKGQKERERNRLIAKGAERWLLVIAAILGSAYGVFEVARILIENYQYRLFVNGLILGLFLAGSVVLAIWLSVLLHKGWIKYVMLPKKNKHRISR